jgi:hypothetical protein
MELLLDPKYIITQGIFCVLFVALLVYILKDVAKRESKAEERENKMVALLESYSKHLPMIAETMVDIQGTQIKIEGRLEKLEESARDAVEQRLARLEELQKRDGHGTETM